MSNLRKRKRVNVKRCQMCGQCIGTAVLQRVAELTESPRRREIVRGFPEPVHAISNVGERQLLSSMRALSTASGSSPTPMMQSIQREYTVVGTQLNMAPA